MNSPVAVSINHGADGLSYLSESGARDFIELLRAAIKDAPRSQGCTISTVMETTKGAARCEWTPDNARRFANDLEAALSLREARFLAKGRCVGQTTRYKRDAANELVEARTSYQY